MEKIASFTVNHPNLVPGVYVSRKDTVGQEVLTTFDLRMTTPNKEPVMNTAEMHTIEHLGATYLGHMGCRTGFYLILAGDLTSRQVLPVVTAMFEFIRDFQGEVPGAAARDCGNYLDMNLPMANYLAKQYLDRALLCAGDGNLNYPE